MIKYRKEIKYTLSSNDFNFLRINLEPLLKKDEHILKDHYTISSIYFDDYNKTSYNQVLNGISERWKYRIRFYNYDNSFITLEKKQKINSLTDKKSIRINTKMLESILNRKVKVSPNNDPLLNEFIIKINTTFLRPIIIIEYDRIPYISKLGNVRITLDYNIRYTNRFDSLFDCDKRVYYLNEKILEVKYDEFIPDYIRYKLQLNHLEISSFSKFNRCLDELNRRF